MTPVSVLILIGLPSIIVMKLACMGRMSNFPAEFSEDTQLAVPSQITFWGEVIFTRRVIIQLSSRTPIRDPCLDSLSRSPG